MKAGLGGCQRKGRLSIQSNIATDNVPLREKLFLPLMGLLALAWFLIRVVPKPIRATYPCQRAAFPLASGIIVWLLGLKAVVLLRHYGRVQAGGWVRIVPWVAVFVSAAGLAAWGIGGRFSTVGTLAWVPSDPANTPMGTAKGLHPGRVVWMRDVTATPWNGSSGHWWDDTTGVNQAAVDHMMSRSLRALTSATNDAQAWNNIFQFYNSTHGRGSVGYQATETVALKINCNNCYSGYGDVDNHIDAAPQSVLSMLRQLVNQAGVPQNKIVVYEATRVVPNRIYTKCHTEFPNVIWMDSQGTGSNGREPVNRHANVFSYSEANTGCGTGIPERVYQATYLVNMAVLKGHWRSGVTLTAKNHFGTVTPPNHSVNTIVESWLHPMGVYHPFVDLVGTRYLGGKTVLFMVDGLYGTLEVESYVNTTTAGWNNLFNGQWSASYFMSLDPVAVDSVGVDFLRSEFGDRLASGHNANCDNYLHEAALANDPPSETVYCPDGTNLPSLGVHEHWNNATSKQYTRNLSTNGLGIELLAAHAVSGLSISITNPSSGAFFVPGSNVPLQTEIEAGYSIAARVDFYRNGALFDTRTNSPFDSVWSNATTGSWAFKAVVVDSDNFAATSVVVNVTVQTNSAPVLAPVTDRLVNAGITLMVTNSAVDPEVPPQALAYSLPVAPAGALIDSGSGLFTWRPAAIQAGSTNLVRVRVADNCTPFLSATQSFWIRVNPLATPTLSAAGWSNGQFQFRVAGDFGPDYQIQASTNLNDAANWGPVFTTNSPLLPFLWIHTNPGSAPMRLYRTVLEP